MRRVALVNVLAACSSAPPRAARVDNVTTPAAPPATVLFVTNTVQTAFILTCAKDGAISDDPATCLGLWQDGAMVGDGLGRTYPLGAPHSWPCREVEGTGYGALFAEQPLSDDHEMQVPLDVPSQLIAFPAERIRDLKVAGGAGGTTTIDLGAARQLLRGWVASGELFDVEPADIEKVEVESTLRADLDGDGAADEIISIVAPDDLEDSLASAVIARLSSGGDPVLLRGSRIYLRVLGAIDLDGDGRDELIDVESYAAARVVRVSQLVDGALVAHGFEDC